MLRLFAPLACTALLLTPLAGLCAENAAIDDRFEPWLTMRNGKWGYLEHIWGKPQQEWKTAIPFEYDWASTFNGRTSATVRVNGKYGLVNRQRRRVVPAEYDYAFPFQNGMAVVYRDGKYGAVDETGKLIIPVEYDHVYPFRDMGTAAAAKGDKCGVINHRGEIIVPFEHALAVTNGTGICGGYIPKVGWKYVDWKGRALARESFKTIDYHSDGVTGVIREDKRMELIDWATGKAVLPGEFRSVNYDEKTRICIVETESGEGAYDLERGTWILPAEYSDVGSLKEGAIRAVRKSGDRETICFVRRDGSKFADADFEDAGYFSDGLVEVQLKGKWGVINADGAFVVPCDFKKRDHLQRVEKHFYAVWVSGKGWGAFDKTGRQVLPYAYSNPDGEKPFEFPGSGKYSKVYEFATETVGLINTSFEWVVPPGTYKEFRVASECMDGHDYVPFERGNVKGLYDLTARKEILAGSLDITVATDYDHISVLGKDGRWGIIDFVTWKHRPAEGFEYDNFDYRTQCFTVVNASTTNLKGGQIQRFGVVNLNGKFVIPLEYEKISKDTDVGLYIASKNDRVGFLDFQGRTVVPFKFEPVRVGDFIRDVSFVEGHTYLRQKGEMVLVDTKGNVVARASQFHLPQTDRLIFRQVGNMKIHAAESESGEIHFLVNGRRYERPGGSIDKDKDDLDLKEGRMPVRREGKWGYLNEEGVEVIPCQFEEAGQFNGGTAFVKRQGTYHLINHGGTVLSHSTPELLRLRRRK